MVDWPARVARLPRHGLEALATVLLAPRCAGCAELQDDPLSGPVCARCWASVCPLTPPLCDGCGAPLPSWRAVSHPDALCARCCRRPRAVDRGRAAGTYDGALRRIVSALKYEGRRSLAKPLAELMRLRGQDVLAGADCLVPVPLHWRRHHTRGFNQATELALGLGLPVCCALRRVRATRPQVQLPAAQRHRNVRNAFALSGRGWLRTRSASRKSPVQGRRVVLVDDVSTTGATLEECARVLKTAGALEVRALTAARAFG
jgi:ComF family protein